MKFFTKIEKSLGYNDYFFEYVTRLSFISSNRHFILHRSHLKGQIGLKLRRDHYVKEGDLNDGK